MNTIIPGQFFDEFDEDNAVIAGWTVLHTAPHQTEDGKNKAGGIVCIRNDRRTATPVWIKYEDVSRFILDATWVETCVPRKPRVNLDRLKPEKRLELEAERDRRHEIIRPILALGSAIFNARHRWKMVEDSARKHKVAPAVVWMYLCLYWQFGNSPDGLFSRASVAGAKSLQRRFEKAQDDPASFKAYKPGALATPEAEPGKAIEYADVIKCRRGAKMFLFRPSPDHSLVYNWQLAHDQVLDRFYGHANDPKRPAPSKGQFELIVRSDPKFVALSKKIVGDRRFDLSLRQLHGSSKQGLLGPGQQLQIDDCVSKVILLDPLTRLPVGQGRFFSCIDTFSGLVCGVHETLENSTYEEACECLYITFSDKAAIFTEYGIDADASLVPAKGVFKTIVADNGPFKGGLSDDLPRRLGGIINTPGYRPDRKPDIESSFHAYAAQLAAVLPGYNRIARCRGDDNPSVIAYLTTEEYRHVLWKWVEYYNTRPLKNWLPAVAMESEHPPEPCPISIWNWGMQNCAGNLVYKAPNDLRRALLTRSEVTLSPRRGIKLHGLVYLLTEETDATAPFNGLLKSKRVGALYSKKYTGHIYIELNGDLLLARLRPDLVETFSGLTFDQVAAKKAELDRGRRSVGLRHNNLRRRNIAGIKTISKKVEADNLEHFGSKQIHEAVAKASIWTLNRQNAVANERAIKRQKIREAFTGQKSAPTTPEQSPEIRTPANQLSVNEMIEG